MSKKNPLMPGRFYVMSAQCNQCLFGSNKIVPNKRRTQLLRECTENDTHFVCHKATLQGENVCCAGFAAIRSTNLMRIAERLGVYTVVDVGEYEDDSTKESEHGQVE